MADQIIYVLTNEGMPGLLKIGRTNQPLSQRIAQLSGSTSAPFPFQCAYAVAVDDAVRIERVLKQLFDGQRENKRREFFRVTVAEVVSALAPYANRVVNADEEAIETQAYEAERRRSAFYGEALMAHLPLDFVTEPAPSPLVPPQVALPLTAPPVVVLSGRVPKLESWSDYWLTTMHPLLFTAIMMSLACYGLYLILPDPWAVGSAMQGMILMLLSLWMLKKRSNGEDRRYTLLNPDPPKPALVPRTRIRFIAAFLCAKHAAELWIARVPQLLYLAMAMTLYGTFLYIAVMMTVERLYQGLHPRDATARDFLVVASMAGSLLLTVLRSNGTDRQVAIGERPPLRWWEG